MSSSVRVKYSVGMQAKQRDILLNVLNSQQFTDVTFVVGEEEARYNIHRLFLSAISPVFDAMLHGSMKESQFNEEVILLDMQPDVFECIVNFAYCNDPKISDQNIVSLISACDKYQIEALLEICHESLRSCLNKNNVCTLCNEAVSKKICGGRVRRDLLQFLAVQSDADVRCLLNKRNLLNMELEAMRIILAAETLECDEEALWDAVLKWAAHKSKAYRSNRSYQSVCALEQEPDEKERDIANTEEYKVYLLKSVRDLMRFGAMRASYFVEFVEPQNIFTRKELCSILLYYQDPKRGCGSFKTENRRGVKIAALFDGALPIPYEVEMSSIHRLFHGKNARKTLQSMDVADGICTKRDATAFIEIRFERQHFVKHMLMAPWGSNIGELNDKTLQYVENYGSD
mmetsp:Transcript_8160/g.13325  ORF Transcript_8160/g.13325 Transcript_8160/m.13325 type:complete len:401 (+) Transcript_8160:47-1249(+)